MEQLYRLTASADILPMQVLCFLTTALKNVPSRTVTQVIHFNNSKFHPRTNKSNTSTQKPFNNAYLQNYLSSKRTRRPGGDGGGPSMYQDRL